MRGDDDIPVFGGGAVFGGSVDDGFSFFTESVGEFSIMGREGREESGRWRARDGGRRETE